MNDYKKWIEKEKPTGIREKYYKGLGTSTATEAKEYFTNLSANRKRYKFKETLDLPIIVVHLIKNKQMNVKNGLITFKKSSRSRL